MNVRKATFSCACGSRSKQHNSVRTQQQRDQQDQANQGDWRRQQKAREIDYMWKYLKDKDDDGTFYE